MSPPAGGRRSGRLPGRRRRAASSVPAQFEQADAELAEVLHSLRGAANYTAWIHHLLEPHLGDRVLEVGAGHGDLTDLMRRRRQVVATDLSDRCVAVLRDRFGGDPGVDVRRADLEEATDGSRYDSVVAVNVLEHVEDDGAAMRAMARSLRPGGTVALWVPAFPALYTDFDRRIGHHRRYRRGQVERLLVEAGLEPRVVRYVNSAGAVAWWLFAKVLRQVPTQGWSVRLYDRLAVPVLRRVEARVVPPFGQSVLAVGAVSGGPGGASAG